jgi:hypothetical protein
MDMQNTNSKPILRVALMWAWTLSVVSCAGDPWPEPDSIEPTTDWHNGTEMDDAVDDTSSGKDTEVPTDADVDTDTDTDFNPDTSGEGGSDDTESGNGTEIDTAPDTDTRDEGEDAGDVDADSMGTDSDEVQDEVSPDDYLAGHVFLSAPNADGFVTIAGLPGAIVDGRTASCTVGGNTVEIPIGVDLGFALRVNATVEDIITITVSAPHVATATTSLAVPGDNFIRDWMGFVGNTDAPTNISDSLISITGYGADLAADMLMISADISTSGAEASEVVCDGLGASCLFNVVLSGRPTDDIDLFMVPLDQNEGTAPASTPHL